MLSVVKIPADRSSDEESAAEFVIKFAVTKSGHRESADGCFMQLFLCRTELREVTGGAKASVALGSAHTQADISRVGNFIVYAHCSLDDNYVSSNYFCVSVAPKNIPKIQTSSASTKLTIKTYTKTSGGQQAVTQPTRIITLL
jgi:hypothetical protein